MGKYKNDYINSTCNVPLYLYQEGLLMLDRCQDSIEVSGSGVDCGYLCTYYCGLFVMCMVTFHIVTFHCVCGYWLQLLMLFSDLLTHATL